MVKNRSRKNHPVPRRRRAPAQAPSNGFSQGAHVPARFPAFPRQLQFHSSWNSVTDVELNTGYSYTERVGLFDFINKQPMYSQTMYSIYRYCRISAVAVDLEVAPEYTGTGRQNSIEAVLAPIPNAQALASPAMTDLRSVRDNRYVLCPSFGANKIRLRGTWNSFDQLGNPTYTRDTWQTVTQAASTSIDIDHPVIYVRVSSVGMDTQPVSIKLTVTYHMQWFDLEFVSLPVSTSLAEERHDDEFECTKSPVSLPGRRDSYVEPVLARTKLSKNSLPYSVNTGVGSKQK